MHGGHLLGLCSPTGPEGSRQSDKFLPCECVRCTPHPPFDPHRHTVSTLCRCSASISLSLSLFPSFSLPRGLRQRHWAYYRAPLPQWSATQATDIGYGVMEAAESSTDSSPNCTFAILACLALSIVYVASLYVWSSPHNRYVCGNASAVAKRRRRRRRRRCRDHRILSTSMDRSPPRAASSSYSSQMSI